MNPHLGQPILMAGAAIGAGDGVVVLIHGRGGSAESMLELANRINRPSFTYLAPAAANHTWYPQRFMEPLAANEPYLSYALAACHQLVTDLLQRGIALEKIVLLGFSQGACLTAEYAARHAARYGGIVIFTGGLIGPPGTRWDYPGSFAGTPVFLGSSDVDAWVPLERVQESTALFQKMGATVTERIYPGMEHLVNDDEIACARAILEQIRNSQ